MRDYKGMGLNAIIKHKIMSISSCKEQIEIVEI